MKTGVLKPRQHTGRAWNGELVAAGQAAISAALVLGVGLAVSVAGSAAAGMEPPSLQHILLVMRAHGGAQVLGPAGVAVDSKRGEILLANTGMNRIDIFDLKGRPVSHIDHRVAQGDGSLAAGEPRDMAVDSAGHLLVIDNKSAGVDVLDFRGRVIACLELLPPDNDPTGGGGPGCVAVKPDGTILVGTRGEEGRVYRFGRDFRLQGYWGESGKKPGQLSSITGLAVFADGRTVVTCATTELAVQVFDDNDRYVTGWGRHDIGPGNFSLPSGVTITKDARIWVSDEIRQSIQVFDAEGSFLGMVGGGGEAAGDFLFPSALASDGESLLVVAERVGNRLQLMKVR